MVGLGGVNNVFSHVSLILVATFSIFAKSVLTNFLFSWEEKLVVPLIATPNGEVRK